MTMRGYRVALASLFVAIVAPVSAATPSAKPGGLDPRAAWETFLATADSTAVNNAYEALDAVGYDGELVEPDRCVAGHDALGAAVAVVPVSLALRRASYLCAQAAGDGTAADRAMDDLAVLSRDALRGAGDLESGRPIRVVAPVDAAALVVSSGLQVSYLYYPQQRPTRYFPLVLAAKDADTGAERHLVFDFVDVAYRLDRSDKFAGFPVLRNNWVDGYIKNGVKGRQVYALDARAVIQAVYESGDEQLKTLREGAALAGIESAHWWLVLCARKPSEHCADGLVDALLPQAEKQFAYPMVLLALAQLDGVGTTRNADAAWALLDGANRHWPGEAIAQFTRIWRDIHPSGSLPPPLVKRLEQARAGGNRYYQRLLIAQKLQGTAKPVLDAGDIGFLSEPVENGIGRGYGVLADYYKQRGEIAEMLVARRKAAEAGWADAQYRYGYELEHGQYGLARDQAAGRTLLAAAAHGGSDNAMTYLGEVASFEGRWRDAEAWQLAAMMDADVDAAVGIAELYEHERPGVSGKIDRAILIYRALDNDGSATGRRHLAALALEGRGMPKDPAQARKWLLVDAEKDDPKSQMLLGHGLVEGRFGAPDEAEGVRWMERALATKDDDARDDFAFWLYNRKATRDARRRALSLWADGDAGGDRLATNGLAWALCTGDEADFDPKRGLDVAKRMGDPAELPAGLLDTLAACYGAAGNFAQATTTQQQVIERLVKPATATPDEWRKRMKPFTERLDLYRSGTRYRDAEGQSSASKPNSSVSLTVSPTK